jgi:7,8-dihydroneopterin aldolase/epimerase/oxygenase
MTDVIRIRGLRAKTRIGVTEEERGAEQVVIINIDIRADLTRPGETDDLADTIDYDSTITEVVALVRAGERKLLEHLAEEIGGLITRNKNVKGVTVEIAKENLPVDEDVDGVVVRIERPRT